ncbi:MAG TPA: putative LPS assembly protein LptD, partial [Sphingobacteriaceae bacterium]
WYQKINVAYSARGSNSITTKDTLLFRNTSLKDFDNGVQHNIPISFSTNILNVVQFSASSNLTERWYLQSVSKQFNTTTGRVETDTTAGFSRAGEYNLSTGMSTKVYGQVNFRKGKLLALRHVATPSVSFSYRPDFAAPHFGNYKYVYTNAARTDSIRYSVHETSQLGSPGIGRQAAIGFNLDNNLEAKVRSNADSLTNTAKIPILQSLSFNGSYNFAADSLKLNPISFSGRTALFKEKLGLNFFGTFNPYQFETNELGGSRVINRFTLRDGKLARLTNFGLSFDFSLNSEAVASRNRGLEATRQSMGAMTPEQAEELARISRDPASFVDFNVPWNVSLSYNFQYSKPFDQSQITNTLNVQGDFNVTNNWKVTYTSGYDFQLNKISITQFSIYRDLHCWDLSFSWMPFGPWKSYSMDLKVKASILQDLKLSRRRSHSSVY